MNYKRKGEHTKKTVSGYFLKEVIGSGFSSEVYKAVKDDKVFAIKIIKTHLVNTKSLKQDQLNKIKTQLGVQSKINHPNLIKIYEGGLCKTTKLLYLAMEYLDSNNFTTLSEYRPNIDAPLIKSLLSQISSAVELLHHHKIVHRDIKPSNIMISKDERSIILLDLGVIKQLVEEKDDDKSYQGSDVDYLTLRYSPIEMLSRTEFSKEKDYDWRALSTYQLGGILFYLLTGKRLFPEIKDESNLLRKAIETGVTENDILNHIRELAFDTDLVQLTANCLSTEWRVRMKKVQWSHFNFQTFEPTIVFLYAGGTIGSKAQPGKPTRAVRGTSSDNFLEDISRRIRRDYRQIHEPNKAFPFTIQWNSLPEEDIILSENATPKYWNAIIDKIHQITLEFSDSLFSPSKINSTPVLNKYLAGIVILHGTDTMAYTSSALAFGLRNIPCPILITGSNQPPDENSILENNLLASKSDAWRNLLLSVNFIRSFGHRYTEVFVAFNNTIYHAFNLKKVPLANTYESWGAPEIAMNEPYTFQNIFLQRKYMFKLVDGIFCNNFYPVNGYNYTTLLEGMSHLRTHVSYDPHKLSISKFDENNLELIYCSPISEYSNLNLDHKEGIVLVGFDSGTFPSDPKHPMSALLKKLTADGKIIFLISEYGMFPTEIGYSTHGSNGEIEIIRIYGMIKETAIPFILSLLSKAKTRQQTIKRSKKKISVTKKFFEAITDNDDWNNSLPGIVLGTPNHQGKLKKQMEDNLQRVVKEFDLAQASLLNKVNLGSVDLFDSLNTRTSPDNLMKNWVMLDPALCYWFFLTKCKNALELGFGPSEFKELNELGFQFGKRVFMHATKQTARIIIDDIDTYIKLDSTDKKDNIGQSMQSILKNFLSILAKMRIVKVSKFSLDSGENNPNKPFRCKLDIYRSFEFDSFEKFAIKQNDQLEREFYNKLREGTPYGTSNADFLSALKKDLYELNHATWIQQHLQPMDWFVIGIFKAFASSILLEVRYDPWIKHIQGDKGHKTENYLKDSIQTRIIQTQGSSLSFEMTYHSREYLSK